MSTDPPHPTPPSAGQPLHTRTVAIDVSLEAPGRLRADGEILDLRKVGVVPTGGDLDPLEAAAMLVTGRVETAEGVTNVIAERLAPLPLHTGERSRDFR